ncbi:hypothetical protein PAGU2595_021780 [Lysobacter xanthus]
MIAMLALLLPLAAAAQTVQKCVDRAGHARYQSEPCARGEKTVEIWDAIPDAEPDPAPLVQPARRRTARRTRSVRTGSGSAYAATADACERARAYRESVERRVGLARNYDLLSALDRRVFDACR